MGLRLHPKHGVNPTIPICYWCGKERNEIVLLGAAYRKEAPMRMLMDYEPCDECKAGMARGVTLVEVAKTPNFENQTSMVKEKYSGDPNVAYPTGTWVVVTEDWVKRTINPPELRDAILKQRKAFILKSEWDGIGLPRGQQDAEAKGLL